MTGHSLFEAALRPFQAIHAHLMQEQQQARRQQQPQQQQQQQ